MRHTSVAGIAALLLVVLSAAASAITVDDPGLIPYQIVDMAIPQPLTAKPGDPAEGKKVAIDRRLGNCLSCHSMPLDEPDQGNIAPPLKGMGSIFSAAQLRLRVVNPKVFNPATIMPAYYRTAGLHDVGKNFQGKPILAAQQVEDLVAYLVSLK